MTEVSQGTADRGVQARRPASSRRPSTRSAACCPARHGQDGQGAVHQGHRADRRDNLHVGDRDRRGDRPALAGRLHRPDGRPRRSSTSAGPRRGSRRGRRPTQGWQPAPPGARRRRRPEAAPGRRTSTTRLPPVRPDVGRRRSPTEPGGDPHRARRRPDPCLAVLDRPAAIARCPRVAAAAGPDDLPRRPIAGCARRLAPASAPDAEAAPEAAEAAPAPLGQSQLTIVAPSPPSPRSPAPDALDQRMGRDLRRTASRSAPVPRPWMMITCSSPASEASSR